MKNIILFLLLIVSIGVFSQKMKTLWVDDIKNPENSEFVNEVAFHNGIKYTEVTQVMFDARYGEAATQQQLYGENNTIVEQEFDSITNITYVDKFGERSPVYLTKNNKLYISKVSKNTGNYYRKYVQINQPTNNDESRRLYRTIR